MIGERNLELLITTARPSLAPESFVFVAIPGEPPVDRAIVGTFREEEGTTLIAERAWAKRNGLSGTFPCRLITLTVHSSLEAVGLIAAVANALSHEGIAVNPVSAYHHDHLFVAEDDATRAMEILNALMARGRGEDR